MNNERKSCSLCQGDLTHTTITYTQTLGDRVYIVTDVPAEVCSRCGEQYLSPDTVDSLQELIEKGKTPHKTIQVPVYQFSQATA